MTGPRAVAIVIVAFMMVTAGGRDATAAGASGTASLIEELNGYAGLLGRTLDARQVGRLEAALPDAGSEVAALLSALLYRADAAKHRSTFAARFTIDDYGARAGKKTKMISQEEFTARIKRIEEAHPGLAPPLMLLVSFTTLRDGNLWFRIGTQDIAVSRFLRGAFLAQVFKGSTIDPVAVANELDEQARRRFESRR